MQETNSQYDSCDLRNEILNKRYLAKDEQGKRVETVKELWCRVTKAIAAAELDYGGESAHLRYKEEFYRILSGLLFLPNSPTLFNAGCGLQMLSACFVVPVPDSLEGILQATKDAGLIQKSGGGVGFGFSKVRQAGAPVLGTVGVASGPVSFMKGIDAWAYVIKQGGRRRAANMAVLRVDHPDIEEFIRCKAEGCQLEAFNLSVGITDEFMSALSKGEDCCIIDPRTGEPIGQRDSNKLWNLICESAWQCGDPGLIFLDKVNADNPTPHLGPIEATNPCGEQPLLGYEACNLGSINIARFVTECRTDLHWDSLATTAELAVRFLDDVIDVSDWPVPQTREITLGNRKIGLGIMGFADALVLLGIRYDSEEAVAFAQKLARFIQEHAHEASEKLAAERRRFPNWSGSIWDTKYHRPVRNASCTTIAPTGSISLIAGCNGGIEPIFSIASKRTILDGEDFVQVAPVVEYLGVREGWLSDKVRRLLSNGVSPRDIPVIPRELANVLVTAHEIDPEWHVRIQAAFQKHVDNAVSKTVNLPANATIEDVDKTFRFAYELGCKGITVYRDGSHPRQVITAAHKATGSSENVLRPRPRVRKTSGETTKFRMGCGTLFVTVNKDESGICEIFANLGKAGGCPSQSEATCRVVSAALRSGVDPKVLVEQLRHIRCLSTAAGRKTAEDIDVLSCPDAIARAIEGVLDRSTNPVSTVETNLCPDCSLPLRKESGCLACVCGYSRCG